MLIKNLKSWRTDSSGRASPEFKTQYCQKKKKRKRTDLRLRTVAHACNASYLGRGDGRIAV
jgi:hypothetical protein